MMSVSRGLRIADRDACCTCCRRSLQSAIRDSRFLHEHDPQSAIRDSHVLIDTIRDPRSAIHISK